MRFSLISACTFMRGDTVQFNISNTKLDCNPSKIDTCVNDTSSRSNVFIWQDEKREEYQIALRNEQACHAFEEMLCAATEGCNTDTLFNMFNGMLEIVISPLFPARKHISKERKCTQNNPPLTLGMIKNVNP